MKQYVGLDVSQKETSVCVVDESGRVVKWCGVNTDLEERFQAEARVLLHVYGPDLPARVAGVLPRPREGR